MCVCACVCVCVCVCVPVCSLFFPGETWVLLFLFSQRMKIFHSYALLSGVGGEFCTQFCQDFYCVFVVAVFACFCGPFGELSLQHLFVCFSYIFYIYVFHPKELDTVRAQELCESRGGRPGLTVPNSPCGLREEKATLTPNWALTPPP